MIGRIHKITRKTINIVRQIAVHGATSVVGIIIVVSTTAANASVEGYLSAFSVVQGGDINIFVSSDTATIDIQVRRIDSPGPPVASMTELKATKYLVPDQAWTLGAKWSNPVTLRIPADWSSGLYRVSLSDRAGHETNLDFVVLEDHPGSQSKILVLDNAPTVAAYNNWGGKSTYTFNSTDGVVAPSISLLRPGNHTLLQQEYEFAHWARAMEIPVEYASMLDLHSDSRLLEEYSVVVLVGHSEYWSKEMRDHLEAFLLGGGNALVLSGNTMWWQVRIEGDQLVCYKVAQDDPLNGIDNERVTVNWYAAPVLRPENSVTGLSWRHGGYVNAFGFYPASAGWGGYTVANADHWLFKGAGLKNGDTFGRESTIVGYETDGALLNWVDGKPQVTGLGGTPLNVEVLAYAPAGQSGYATLGIYATGRGGLVFNAATVDWADGLWSLTTESVADPIVSRITRNIFEEFIRPATPENLRINNADSGLQLSLQWDSASGWVTRYELWSAPREDFTDATLLQNGMQRQATITDPMMVHYYRVRACGPVACGSYSMQVKREAPPIVASPLISSEGLVFVQSLVVKLTTTTPAAAIYYSIDGTEPTLASALYEIPIVLTESVQLRARAFRNGYMPSAEKSAYFVRDKSVAANSTDLGAPITPEQTARSRGGGGGDTWLAVFLLIPYVFRRLSRTTFI